MAKSEVDKVTDETIEKGGMLIKLYFDMQSEDASKLQPLMIDLVSNRLLKEKGVIYCYGAIEEPIKVDDVYSTVAEITTLFEKPSYAFKIAFNYAPAGVEILRPASEIRLTGAELQTILMDLSETSVNYSKYILEKVMKPDELKGIKTAIENRAVVGSKVINGEDKSDKKDAPDATENQSS
ncbi:hypothetical protein Mia14_0837 [Candidatus Mancarchaeum acidiphilum]|uniref:Uncharacterized protein n=1 Tax=Candidatus Mancarchaeum acidiphilum TaxID=1920749 RepID=A0A218NNT1_9ARCH|nr:hypothetical protein [Candidatus Mancarchaeum acidiphilum]ASI14125.1 hypothetical protein Mia14_0837 [Candidatus Mancarchaeum acidiphilum]